MICLFCCFEKNVRETIDLLQEAAGGFQNFAARVGAMEGQLTYTAAPARVLFPSFCALLEL